VTLRIERIGLERKARDSQGDHQGEAQERRHFVRLESREAYTIVEGTRSKLSRTPARIRRGVPTLARDNHEILADLLGYDQARMTELALAGVLE
jgi:crotonobetainyl-CoA:carnitine CoA-transferase CaiB-like acyl-CoA transferase